MMFPMETSFVVKAPEVVYDLFDEEVVIVDLVGGSYYSARGGGAVVWRWILDGLSASQMQARIPEAQRPALQAFLGQLCSENLLGIGGPTESNDKAGALADLGSLELEKFTDMEDLLTLDPIHDVDEAGWPHAAKV